MSRSQVKIRLDDRLIRRLKQRAIALHISVSALCNQLLENQVLGSDSRLTEMTTICVKIDNLLSTLRSIDRKISISKEKRNDPN
jgi:plasmid stability protein